MNLSVSLVLVLAGCVIGGTAAGDDKPATPDHSVTATAIEARMFLRHARDGAEAMLFRIQKQTPATLDDEQEFLSGIQRDLRSSNKAIEVLEQQLAKNTDVKTLLDLIKKQNLKNQESSIALAAACKKQPRNNAEISDQASALWNAIDTAETQMTGLLKQLKIVRWDPVSANTPASSDTAGNGFRPQTSAVYLRSLEDHARVIGRYADSKGVVPDATVLEHVGEVERQLTALKKEIAKLDDATRKEKGMVESLKTVEQQQAELEQRIDQLKKSSQTRKLNPTEVKQLSTAVSRHLSQSLDQFNRLIGSQVQQQQQTLLQDFPYSN